MLTKPKLRPICRRKNNLQIPESISTFLEMKMFLSQNIDLELFFPFRQREKGNSVVRKSLFDLHLQNQTF